MHVLVTGASGFIARHIVLALLNAGHRVTGSVRSAAKADHVRASMCHHLGQPVDVDGLDFVTLDLMRDAGWVDALHGKDALVHTASPVPTAQPRDADEIVRPAVEGTVRALNAAAEAGVGLTVLTSSVEAIRVRPGAGQSARFTEEDWSDLTAPQITPYEQSKTRAERTAWDFVAERPDMTLATINPAFVFGPPLDDDFGTSLVIIQRILRSKDPAWPRVSFPVVDVRDVAELHLRALTDPTMHGQRTIAWAGSVWMRDIALQMKSDLRNLRIVTRQAPDWFIRLYARIDGEVASIVPALGKQAFFDVARAEAALGRAFRSTEDAIRDAAKIISDKGWS